MTEELELARLADDGCPHVFDDDRSMTSTRSMQCKDIPDLPILEFLSDKNNFAFGPPWWGTWFNGFRNSVQNAMPSNTPGKLALAKMRMLIRRGLVSGCGCGCRGDFALTDQGKQMLEKDHA